MASLPLAASMNLSPQDILTQKKRQIVGKTYVQNKKGTNRRPASLGTTLLASRILLVTPAISGGTWNNRIALGTAPCCSS